jgi:hypothetical protein
MTNMLNESRGFAARKPGDAFVDPKNTSDQATFQGLTLLPAKQYAYDTPEEFQKAYDRWHNKLSAQSAIYEINKLRSVIKAAMIITMQSSRGMENFVLFTVDNKTPEGKLTSIPPHVVNSQHGGYVLNKSTSLSERAGVKPSDVLVSKKSYKPAEVSALLDEARSTAGDQIVDQMQSYLDALVKKQGTNFVIKNGAQFASVHQKYLGEWAAPIALITSQVQPKSQIPQIQDNMLEGNLLRLGKVEYNQNPTDTLSDSSVVVKGMHVHISSKAHKGGGAAASLKGIHDTIQKNLNKFDPNFWRTKKNNQFRKIVDLIMSKSAPEGVLDLSVDMELIPATEPAKILKLINQKDAKVSLHRTVRALMAGYAANEQHPQYNAGKHALAAIAKKLCDELNNTDYTLVAKTILSMSNIVQMMFVTGIQGKDLIAKGFDLIWPPEFDGKIYFYSGKNFSATEIKGKLGFKISKSKEPDEPDPSLTATSMSAAKKSELKKQAELKVGKIVTPGARDRRDPKVSDLVALGRAKKKPAK